MQSLRPTRSLLIIGLMTFGVFAPSLANDFAMDDSPLAQSVDQAGHPDEIIVGMRAPWWYFGQRYWAGTTNSSVLYRPVTVLSFAVTYNWVSRWLPEDWEAFPHHLINILLHCFAVYLVWWMLRDLNVGEFGAVLCAGTFAFNAIHSEVVAGIVGRAELFSFCFGLWGTLLFAREKTKLALLMFFSAFCSKESGLAWAPFLPCYMLARHRLHRGQARVGAVFAKRGMDMAVALAIPLAAFLILRWFAIQDLPTADVLSYTQNPLAYVETGPRFLTAVKLLGYGLWKCLAPFSLACLYGPGAVSIVESPWDLGFLAALAVCLTWLVAGLLYARRAPLLFLSMTAFLGFSFITSNLPIVIGTIFGERLYYMPSLGVCLLPAILVGYVGDRGRRLLVIVLGLWTIACCGVILLRNGAWKNNEVLFVGDAERLHQSADLQAKAGYVLMAKDPERAMGYFKRSVAVDENLAGAWASIGRLYQWQGDFAQAAENYKRALDTKYVATSGTEDRTIVDYIKMLAAQVRIADLLAYCKEVLQRKPDHQHARTALLDYGWGRLAPVERRQILADGLRRNQDDVALQLIGAMDSYESDTEKDLGLEVKQRIAGQLGWALENLPPGTLDTGRVYRARLYLGAILAALGNKEAAIGVLQELLMEKDLSQAARKEIEAEVQRLRR